MDSGLLLLSLYPPLISSGTPKERSKVTGAGSEVVFLPSAPHSSRKDLGGELARSHDPRVRSDQAPNRPRST